MSVLVLVDIQNDFLPGGSLAVSQGEKILPVVNKLLTLPFDSIIATKDWHPKSHQSFAANHCAEPGQIIILRGLEQILWPVHCVQDTYGAELSKELNLQRIDKIIYKGTDESVDSYSTFFDNGHFKSTGLDKYLREQHLEEVYIAGLATDYCVKYSALDALKLGYKTYVVIDACQGVNLNPNDSREALDKIKEAGGVLITSQEVTKKIGRGSGL